MNGLRNGVLGIMGAFATGLMVIGAIGLGLLEAVPLSVASPTPRSTLPPPNLTPLPGTEQTATPRPGIPTPIALVTFAFTPTSCPPPAGWERYVVNPGDDLITLAKTRGSNPEQIMGGNCLITAMLLPGTVIYVPPVAIAVRTTVPAAETPRTFQPSATLACDRPAGWIVYTVKFGDNLTRIAITYRISVSYLKQVNCLTDNNITVGMKLWVPNVPTSTFTSSPTATSTPTDQPEPPSATPVPPTDLPTLTDTPTFTPTVTPVPPTLTDTPTHTPTETTTPTPAL
ncbi:MAG TPA: LysM peptidoglycan-binding domain-containing protein [Bellilinea sp.]